MLRVRVNNSRDGFDRYGASPDFFGLRTIHDGTYVIMDDRAELLPGDVGEQYEPDGLLGQITRPGYRADLGADHEMPFPPNRA